jgi:hypothetical protein
MAYISHPAIEVLFPYPVEASDPVNFHTLHEMNLKNITDYIYWRNNMRFKDASSATMYKLMCDI